MERETESTDSVTREEIEDIEEVMIKNQTLLEENNRLLKKINRSNMWAFWLRLLWIAIILGVPFIIYYYLLGPYFELFGVQLPEITL
tara:strand:+ start:704 stop:964 length:261 start_codon:yes stop_codon:yes gene_type:complete